MRETDIWQRIAYMVDFVRVTSERSRVMGNGGITFPPQKGMKKGCAPAPSLTSESEGSISQLIGVNLVVGRVFQGNQSPETGSRILRNG